MISFATDFAECAGEMLLPGHLLYSLYVFCVELFAQGMNDGMVAPTLVDLEMITGGNPQTVSVMFTLRALCIVLGCVVTGKLIQRFPKYTCLMIGVALVFESVFGVIIPWLPTPVLVDLASGVSALFTGAIIVGE